MALNLWAELGCTNRRVCGKVLQLHAVPKPDKRCKQDHPDTCPTLNPARLWEPADSASMIP